MNKSEVQPPKALGGIRVLSFSQLAQGPAAVQLIADLGADVIKIERPGAGAFERSWSGANAFVNGVSVFFMSLNRNQRSVTINIKDPRGQDIIHRLVDRADVLIENYRPGVLDRIGLGYVALAERNPRLIYCSASGYGTGGPYREYPGQDLIVQGLSGLASLTGTAQDLPTPVGVPVVDYYAAALLAFGICAALVARTHTGRGQKVETNLLSSALHLQIEPLSYQLNGFDVSQRSRSGLGSTFHQAPYGVYVTQDGYITISLNDLSTLAEVLGVEALRVFTGEEQMTRRDEIRELVQAAVRKRPTEEWLQRLTAAGIWGGRVHNYHTLFDDPQVQWLDMFRTITHPQAGQVRVVRSPVEFSDTPPAIERHPPQLGEHTDEILREVGYGDQDISGFRREGVI